jgi:hypothetical protein
MVDLSPSVEALSFLTVYAFGITVAAADPGGCSYWLRAAYEWTKVRRYLKHPAWYWRFLRWMAQVDPK